MVATTHYTDADVRAKYEAAAPWYDRMILLGEWLGIRRLRRRQVGQARGDVLEVAVGTGANLRHYPPDCRITAVDLSPAMLAHADAEASRLGREVALREMSAERLAFPDDSFDTVVSSLSTCTFPAPVAALREMARVCRPGGRILLLEHGRSNRERVGRWQDRRAARNAESLGCVWNREPLQLARGAGLDIVESRRCFFGVFHTIVAAP